MLGINLKKRVKSHSKLKTSVKSKANHKIPQ